MLYESGTRECHILVESKNRIERILFDLKGMENIDHISSQLLAIYNQLDGIHELYRSKRISNEEVRVGNREPFQDATISFQSQVPLPLKKAMNTFIERYPNWDQYRLLHAALAGFLVQNGVRSREITRLYVGNMFDSSSLLEDNRN